MFMRLAPSVACKWLGGAVLAVLLSFQTVAAAEGEGLTQGTWQILEIAGQVPSAKATIYFKSFRFVGLNEPCNARGGWFTSSGDNLKINVFGPQRHDMSRMMDSKGMLNCYKIDYGAALGRVRKFKVDGDSLSLLGADGELLARLKREPAK